MRPGLAPELTWGSCSHLLAYVTLSKLQSFVRRAGAFPSLRFAIVGVDALSVPAREALARAIVTPLGRRADIALVFREATGMSALTQVAKTLDLKDHTAIPTPAQVRMYAGCTLQPVSSPTVGADAPAPSPDFGMFTSVTLVAGESGIGKSYWIKKQLPESGSLAIAVHGSLDVLRFIKEYRARVESIIKPKPLGRPAVGLHINLFASAVPSSGPSRVASTLHALFTQVRISA